MSYEYWAQTRTLERPGARPADPVDPDAAAPARPRGRRRRPEGPGPDPKAPARPRRPGPGGAGAGARSSALTRRYPSFLQAAAAVVGLVFAAVGVLGFVPGITSRLGDLGLAGRGSDAELLGLFEVSALHNVVHLVFGVGLLAGLRASWAKLYLVGGGVVYAGVWLYGSLVDLESGANFLPFNTADNYLHFLLAVTMVALGLLGWALLRRRPRTA